MATDHELDWKVYVRMLMGMLRNYVNNEHDDWEDVLELVCFAYRSSVHSATCESP